MQLPKSGYVKRYYALNQIQLTDINTLNRVIDRMISVIEKSQSQIFDISENARSEYNRIKLEIAETRAEVAELIRQVDELEKLEKLSRIRLMEVSRDFKRYGEEDIKQRAGLDAHRATCFNIGLGIAADRYVEVSSDDADHIFADRLDQDISKHRNGRLSLDDALDKAKFFFQNTLFDTKFHKNS